MTDSSNTARTLLLDLLRGDLFSRYLISEICAAWDDSEGEEESDRQDKVNARLNLLNYGGTTLEAAIAEFEAAGKDELDFWSGRYLLCDKDDPRAPTYSLDVNADGATLTVGDVDLHGSELSDGVLKLEGDSMLCELRFVLPSLDASDSDEFDCTALARDQLRCEGTLTATTSGAAMKRDLQGKRGCVTRAGIVRVENGDAFDTWHGVYSLTDTQDEVWVRRTELLRLTTVDGEPRVELGGVAATAMSFSDNRVSCAFGDTILAGRFDLGPSNRQMFFGAIMADGVPRSVTGFWRSAAEAAKPALKRAMVKGAALTKTAQNVVSPTDVPADARVLEIDLKSPPPEIVLPAGVERNPYHIELAPLNVAEKFGNANAKDLVWDVVDEDGAVKLSLAVNKSKDGVWWINGTFGETQTAYWIYFKLRCTYGTNPPLDIAARVQGVSRNPIDIQPELLDPIYLGREYDEGIAATGGEPPLAWTWEVINEETSVINGPGRSDEDRISFDSERQTFTGTVDRTDREKFVMRTFSVRVFARSSDTVVMLPGVRSYNLQLLPESSALDITNTASGWVAAIGVSLVYLGIWLVRRDKASSVLADRVKSASTAISDTTTVLKSQDIEQIVDTEVTNYKTTPTQTADLIKKTRAAFTAALVELGQKRIAVSAELANIEADLESGHLAREEADAARKQKVELEDAAQRLQERETDIKSADKRAKSYANHTKQTADKFATHVNR